MGRCSSGRTRSRRGSDQTACRQFAAGIGIRLSVEYLTTLDQRLAKFESAHQVAFRIPAVFYPEDSTTTVVGEQITRPESIPWQFYLVNTGVNTHDQAVQAGGEWVLIDLTSSQPYENRALARDLDSAMLQQGALVDPPIGMFSVLNSRIRYPEGRLYFTSPNGQTYVLRTTDPWSFSDFLTALGITLAAVVLIAGVVATGGHCSLRRVGGGGCRYRFDACRHA